MDSLENLSLPTFLQNWKKKKIKLCIQFTAFFSLQIMFTDRIIDP